jgi:hypothetical protein
MRDRSVVGAMATTVERGADRLKRHIRCGGGCRTPANIVEFAEYSFAETRRKFAEYPFAEYSALPIDPP